MALTSLSYCLYPYLLPTGPGSLVQLEPGPSALLQLHHRSTGVQPSNSHARAWLWPHRSGSPPVADSPPWSRACRVVMDLPGCQLCPALVTIAAPDPDPDRLLGLTSDLPCRHKLLWWPGRSADPVCHRPRACAAPTAWPLWDWALAGDSPTLAAETTLSCLAPGSPSTKEQLGLWDHRQYTRSRYITDPKDIINREKPRWPGTWRIVTHLVLWVAYFSISDPLDAVIMEEKMVNAPFDLTSASNHFCHFWFCSVPDTLFVYIRLSGLSTASHSPFYLSALKLFNEIFLFLFQLGIKKS